MLRPPFDRLGANGMRWRTDNHSSRSP
jgi:hypothetical protein